MLFKQLIGNVTAIAPLTINSRKSVEGTLWKWAGDALYIVQSRGDDVTALSVFCPHGGDMHFAYFNCADPGVLHERGRATQCVLINKR